MAITTASLLFSTSAAALTATQIFIGGVVFMGVSTIITNALIPKPKMPTGVGGNLGVRIDPIAHGEIVYGEVRKGGVKTFHKVTGGTKYYHYFLTLAFHEVQEIGDIYINDEVATLDTNGFVTSGDWNSKVLIKKFTGASNQNIQASLTSLTEGPDLPVGFNGANIACLYVRLEYDQNVFKNGQPLITAVVKGKKLYDPRKDSTSAAYQSSLGVSTHRKTNPATWQYSSNPALAIRDYMTSFLGVAADQDEVDDLLVARSANDCASTGVGTENSFEIGGYISTAENRLQNIANLATTLNGTIFFAQGKFKILAGAYHAPDPNVATFTLDDLRSPIKAQTRLSRRDLVNTVRGTFNDKDNRWIGNDFPQIQLPDLSEDNGLESVVDLQLPLTTKSAAAQRLAKQVLYTAREQITVDATFGARAFEVQVGDVIKLTIPRYGWNNKEFLVKGWKATGGAADAIEVQLSLQETSSIVYQWSISSDEYQQITNNNSNVGGGNDGLTINLTVSTTVPVQQPDGTTLGALRLAWPDPSNASVVSFEVRWRRTGAPDYNATTTAFTTFQIDNLAVGEEYEIGVRAVTNRGVKGPWATATETVSGDSLAPKPPTTPQIASGYRTITVGWLPPSQNTDGSVLTDLSGYYVYQSTTNSIPADFTAVVGGSTYTAGGLADDTTYYFWVKAVDYTGNVSTALSLGSIATQPELIDGANAKLVTLTSDGLTFTYDGNGVADPTSQTINFSAALQNTTDTVATFSTSPSVTLSGSGNARSLSIANFGANDRVTVTASADGGVVSDTITIYKLQQGKDGPSVAATRIVCDDLQLASFNTVDSYAVSENGVQRSNFSQDTNVIRIAKTTTLNPSTQWLTEYLENEIKVGDYITVTSTAFTGSVTYKINSFAQDIGRTDIGVDFYSSSGTFTTAISTAAGGATTNFDFSRPKAGLPALVVTQSNETVTVPADDQGVVQSFAGTDNEIRVYQGTTQLTRTNVTTTFPSAGKYYVTTANSNVTNSGILGTLDYVDFPNITAMSADAGTITTTIFATGLDGQNYTRTAIQSFKKSRAVKGDSGPRGAGRWYISVTSFPTSNAAITTLFTQNAVATGPVYLDQVWLQKADGSQEVYIYNSSGTWDVQDEIIDGNLVVAGTLTSDKLQAADLAAVRADLGTVNINKLLRLEEAGASFIAGRTAVSRYNENGFYLGRESRGGSAKGFEVSHTSNTNGVINGIIHTDQIGLEIYNPVIVTGGSTSGAVSTRTTNGTFSIGQVDSVTVTAQGGGGGGGYGVGDGGGSGSAGSGGTTTVYVRVGSSSGTIIATIQAAGGAGGRNGAISRLTNHDGEASSFGAGGAGGSNNSAGASAPAGSYGAGGGGGGGDAPGTFDSSGNAGEGGKAGLMVTQTIDTSAYAGQNIYLSVTIGAAGSGGNGTFDGGNGGAGVVTYSDPLGGTSRFTMATVIKGSDFAELFANYGDIPFYTTNAELYNFRTYDRLLICQGGFNPVYNGSSYGNGDHWFRVNTTSPRRVISQIGTIGQFPNSTNQYLWNNRDVLISSANGDYARSSNSLIMPAFGFIYLQAGVAMRSDRGATWVNAKIIRGDKTDLDLEEFARAILSGM